MKEDERKTVNLTEGLVKKLDLLRYGSESWNEFLERAYPILSKWRSKDRQRRIEKIVGEQGQNQCVW